MIPGEISFCQRAIQAARWAKLRYMDYHPREADLFIAGYPRSGISWIQAILQQLAAVEGREDRFAFKRIPWFEPGPDLSKKAMDAPGQRVFKTHLPYYSLPGSNQKGAIRSIVVVRDGREVAISYYHYSRRHLGYTGDFHQFFREFMQGKIRYGSWFEHVAGWWAHRHDPNVLLINYEDLLHDPNGSTGRIAVFSGFGPTEDSLAEVVQQCSLAAVKRSQAATGPIVEAPTTMGGAGESLEIDPFSQEYRLWLNPLDEAWFDRELARWFGESVMDPVISLGSPRMPFYAKPEGGLPYAGLAARPRLDPFSSFQRQALDGSPEPAELERSKRFSK